ncbi:MAG: hypothetical protein ACM3PU_00300 [Gemmatimonadota bacterium]
MPDLDSAAEVPARESGTPVKMLVGSRADLDSAVLMLLGAARRTVRCASSDLSVFGLAGRAGTDLMRALLLANPANTVRLLVDDLSWIETHAARIKLLQRDFAHALQIRIADREDPVGTDRVLIGDDRHALQLRDAPVVHGELWLHHAAFVQPVLTGFDRRWDRAAHNVAVDPLGL